MSSGILFLTVFLASAVEMVEALTIVLAVGIARSWRSALLGVGAALLALAVVVAALGPALTVLPIDWLRVLVGGLLLVFGLQWLRKGILRASGYVALHDEERIFAEESARAGREGARVRHGVDPYAFTLSFKGVLLEGLEVAFIVLTVGSSGQNIPLAAAAAVAALAAVVVVGAAASARAAHASPRERAEVRGWHHVDDVRHVLGCGGARRLVARRRPRAPRAPRVLRRDVARPRSPLPTATCTATGRRGRRMRWLSGLGHVLYDLFVGDDWRVAVGIVLTGAATAFVVAEDWPAWWLPPLAVVCLLFLSLRRASV